MIENQSTRKQGPWKRGWAYVQAHPEANYSPALIAFAEERAASDMWWDGWLTSLREA